MTKIRNCTECDFYWDYLKVLCLKKTRKIPTNPGTSVLKYNFPKWCPLPDKPEPITGEWLLSQWVELDGNFGWSDLAIMDEIAERINKKRRIYDKD